MRLRDYFLEASLTAGFITMVVAVIILAFLGLEAVLRLYL